MQAFIIQTIWFYQSIQPGEWVLALMGVILLITLYLLFGKPVVDRVHKETWL